MDPRLQYSPEHYSEKLSEYAAYTVDVATPVGTFRQKANKQENISVVDEGVGRFRIYMSYQPLFSFGVDRRFRNPDMKRDFLTIVTIKDDVRIEVQRNKFINYLEIGLYTFFLITVSILLLDKEPVFSLLMLPLIPLPFLIQWVSKKRLETLLIDFLNNIAGK